MEIYKRLLNKRLFLHLVILFFGLLLSTFLETLSFGSIIGFLALITEPKIFIDKINSEYFRNFILKYDQKQLILLSSFLLFFLFLIRNFFLGFMNYLSRKFTYNLVTLNGKKLLSYYLNCSLEFLYSKNPEVITRNIESLIVALCERIFYFITILREVLMMIVVMIAIFFFNTLISTFAFLILMIVSYIFIHFLKKTLKKRSSIAHQFDVNRLKIINELYFNLKEIKLYNLHETVIKNFETALNGVESHRVFFNTVNALPRLFLEMIAITGILLLAVFSSFYEIENQSLVTTITIVAICASRLIPGFQQISTSLNVLNNNKFAIALLKDDIMRFDNPQDLYTIKTTKEDFKKLQFKNVHFSYGSNKKILKNINLEIKEGEKICIVGESGSGKTTLLSIMMGLLDISQGQILLNRKKLNKENLNNFQKQIGYVTQDVFISDDTIINNIAIGEKKSDINMSKINNVVELSNLKNLIDNSTEGLQSKVGTKGIKLSGGQIQRIGIARALYRNPNIIFFDEATSSLDENNEKIIMQNIFNAFKKSTMVFVTHKRQLIKYFDKVIKIENGKILLN